MDASVGASEKLVQAMWAFTDEEEREVSVHFFPSQSLSPNERVS